MNRWTLKNEFFSAHSIPKSRLLVSKDMQRWSKIFPGGAHAHLVQFLRASEKIDLHKRCPISREFSFSVVGVSKISEPECKLGAFVNVRLRNIHCAGDSSRKALSFSGALVSEELQCFLTL